MLLRKLFIMGIAALASGLLLAGCGGSSGGDGTTGASFSVVDAPIDDADAVVVAFDKIVLYPSDGDPVTYELDEPKTIDLLQHQGSNDEMVFENVEAPPGEYDRLDIYIVDGAPNSYVDDASGRHDLFVPGNQGAGQAPRNPLKLFDGFTLAAGNITDFVIDFDLRKALADAVGLDIYLLRPAMRLINSLETGTISGTVDSTLLDGVDETCTSDVGDDGNDVYLYTGLDADVGDVNVDATGAPDHDTNDTDGVTPESNPLTTAEVTQNGDTGLYEYEIGFVATGDYTIAFTCQSLDDMPDTDEDIEFVQPQNVTVQAGQESVVDFTAAAP